MDSERTIRAREHYRTLMRREQHASIRLVILREEVSNAFNEVSELQREMAVTQREINESELADKEIKE